MLKLEIEMDVKLTDLEEKILEYTASKTDWKRTLSQFAFVEHLLEDKLELPDSDELPKPPQNTVARSIVARQASHRTKEKILKLALSILETGLICIMTMHQRF